MSLYDVITSLQKKPDATKRAVLAGVIVVSGIVLLGTWGIMFKGQVESNEAFSAPFAPHAAESDNTKEQADRRNEKMPSPFASLRQGFSLVVSDIQEQIEHALTGGEELETTNEHHGEDREEAGEIPEHEETPPGAWPLPIRD